MMNLLKKPTAFLPLMMSFAAILLVLAAVSLFGAARQADEGAAAHIWQILMAGQLPIILFFAIRWLPRAPRQALLVLVIQAAAGLAALTPVFFFRL